MTMPSLNAPYSPLHVCRATQRLTHVLQLLALLICMFVATGARAGTCSYTSQFPGEQTISIPFNTTITVGRDVPVGTVLYSQQVATGITGSIWAVTCTAGTYTYQYGYASTPYPLASYVDPTLGHTIYQTSVPGIGAVIANWPNALPLTVSTHTFTGTTNYSSTSNMYMTAFLIKIADTVGSGTIKGSDWPVFESSITGDNKLKLITTPFVGTINVVSSTCKTPDVNVDLGTHYTTELKGVGSTTTWVNVPITLTNCPAFYGYQVLGTSTAGGPTSYSVISQNEIGYTVNPVTTIVNASQAVMALQPDGVNTTATGVGIQIADSSNNPVSFGGPSKNSGLQLNQMNNSSYSFSLSARYYQTASTVQAGQANGAATITLTYY